MKTTTPSTGRHRSREHGVALVTTMIVVAVLAVVAVAFMQSTSTDRLSSRTAVNYVQARLVAEAGAAAAEALVADLVRRYPDSATVWQNIGGGAADGTNNEATVLYLRAQSADTNLGARPAQFGDEVTFLARPLVSLQEAGELFPLSDIASALPSGGAEVVNLNATNASRRPFIGSRSMTNAGAPVTAAQWVYIGAQPGPTNATNPAIARYAFWVEDESFKVNVNVVTNGPRGIDSLGLSPAELRLDGSWDSAGSDLGQADAGAVVSARDGLPGSNFPTALTAAIPGAVDDSDGADELKFLTTVHSAGLDLSRGGFKRFNINSVTNGITSPTDAGNIRTGLNRLIATITNSNSVPNFGQRFYRLRNDPAGINSTNAVSTNHAAIYLQKIAANLIDYVDDNDQPTVISNDSSFSLVTGRPATGILPLGGGTSGTNPIAAMGVENVPRLQEYAIHLRVRKMQWDGNDPDSFGFIADTSPGATNPTVAEYEVWLDHYFEFWNPGMRDYTNSPDAFLKIFDQPAWGPGVGGGAVTGVSGRGSGDFTTNNRASSEIPLIDALTGDPVVFPAGEVTVVTTAPVTALNAGANPADFLVVTANPNALVSLANVPAADRVFTGTTTSIRTDSYDYQTGAVNGGPNYGYNRFFEVQMQFGRPGGTSVTDYASGVLIGNDQGIIESHVGLPIGLTSGSSKYSAIVDGSYSRNDLRHIPGNILNGNADNVRAGGMRGNANQGRSTAVSKPNPTEGDPRSLLEQLEMDIYSSGSSGGGANQTRFFNTIGSGGSSFFGDSTFGRPNANYVLATNWTDVSSINPGAANAPLFVRNGPMHSIGELGHVTDPARPYIASGSVPLLARAGGRTLRIGQPELTNSGGTNIAWYDGQQTSASRTWASWRLADIFTTTTASNSATTADLSGNLTNSLGVVRGETNANGAVLTIPGLVNPNGLLRDGEAAIRAVLHDFAYLPTPDGVSGLAGKTLNSFRLNGVVNGFRSRLTNASSVGLPSGALNPFWERGEISELPIFNSGNIPGRMSEQFDRGREELVRRSIEMITTRGSVFTVYAIGQTLQGTNITSVARMKQTFQIEPQFATADAFNDSFNPSQAVRVSRRFAAPTNYTVRVLATSYD